MGPKTLKKAVEPQPDVACMMAAMAPVARKSTLFTNTELDASLVIIQACKARGNYMWKDVESDFNSLAASCEGFMQLPALSLKPKFARLCESKKPTGDPDMLSHVQLAKTINSEIHNDIAAGELDGCTDNDEYPSDVMNSSLSSMLQTGPEAGSRA